MTREFSLGAYLLPGDPIWLRSSVARYYDQLDDLVILVPEDGRGWMGGPIPVAECLTAIEDIDTRGIARQVTGRWTDSTNPMSADTAQRQAGINALKGVDWVLQIDNDEVLPDIAALLAAAASAPVDVVGIEWPMRVIYRALQDGRWLLVTGLSGRPVFEYPGSVLVRRGTRLCDARRPCEGPVQRVVVDGDTESLQVRQPRAADERRIHGLPMEAAIIHNSWGRTPRDIWRKTRTWGHAAGLRGAVYYFTRWLPSPALWRRQRNLHPFADGLWPRLQPETIPKDLLVTADRS